MGPFAIDWFIAGWSAGLVTFGIILSIVTIRNAYLDNAYRKAVRAARRAAELFGEDT